MYLNQVFCVRLHNKPESFLSHLMAWPMLFTFIRYYVKRITDVENMSTLSKVRNQMFYCAGIETPNS